MSPYLLLIVTGACLMPLRTFGQIPAACADKESLENLRCCPTTADGVCGEDAGRGDCVELNIKGYSRNTTNVRDNWPHYFTHVCQCHGNYSGYDCSRCSFGHYGPNCSQSQVLPRRSLASYTDDDWEDFIEIIQLMHSYDSGYVVILEESFPGNSSLLMTNVTLYKLYVWLHQYASKDTGVIGPRSSDDLIDYAHTGPSFTTWHRYFNLWLEWEIKYMLKSMDRSEYHTFRFPYWDWRIEIQTSTGLRAEELFTEARFGATSSSGLPLVFGDIVGGNGGETICTGLYSNICDPNDNTGQLRRCPLIGTDNYNPCHSSNPDWPTIQQVNKAIAIDHYDSPPYNVSSKTGFRPLLDFDIRDDLEDCYDDRMCTCLLPRGYGKCNSTDLPPNYPLNSLTAFHTKMHFIGHIIPGRGYFGSGVPSDMLGNMVDLASPNDPYFIIHHTMIDCIFDEWLKRHPDEEYPDVPLTPSTRGHLPHGYMVPFFPLYTNADMFKPAAGNLGYFCNLPNITIDSEVDNSEDDDSQDIDSGSSLKMYPPWFTLCGVFSLVFIALH